jgi:hypothetical protein
MRTVIKFPITAFFCRLRAAALLTFLIISRRLHASMMQKIFAVLWSCGVLLWKKVLKLLLGSLPP